MKQSLTIILLTISALVFSQTHMADVNVKIVDMSDIPEEGAKVKFDQVGGDEVHEGATDSVGTVTFKIEQGKNFAITVNHYGTEFDFGVKAIPSVGGDMIFDMKFSIGVDTVYEQVYTLNVYFDHDKAMLKPTSHTALDELHAKLKGSSSMTIEIAGHTDSEGNDEYNLKLSKRRSNAVRTYLLKKGIEPKRVMSKGYGEKQPVADNSTEAGRQMNRRTEVRVITN